MRGIFLQQVGEDAGSLYVRRLDGGGCSLGRTRLCSRFPVRPGKYREDGRTLNPGRANCTEASCAHREQGQISYAAKQGNSPDDQGDGAESAFKADVSFRAPHTVAKQGQRGRGASRICGASPRASGYHAVMNNDEPGADQLEALRRMTPEERYRASRALYWTLRRHKAAFLRSVHPEWDDSRIEDEVRRVFLHART